MMRVGVALDATAARPAAVPPLLTLRALRYEAEGLPGVLPGIGGLRVQLDGLPGATSRFDADACQTCFDDLPPGRRRLLVTDPERRYLPAAAWVEVPARYPVRPTLWTQTPGAEAPVAVPLRTTLRLRPSPSRAIPAGMTAVIGRLTDAEGRAIALGRLACDTDVAGRHFRVVTWSDADGRFAILLPRDSFADAATQPPVASSVVVHVPDETLARALAADFGAALPADLDGREPGPVGRPFLPRMVQALTADGRRLEALPGQLPLRPGRTVRWDLVATTLAA